VRLTTLMACGLVAAAPASHGQLAEPPRVDLALTGVKVVPNGQYTIFSLTVEVDNRTGRELKVRSNFTSALDGLILVVRDEKGKELSRTLACAHQSPFAPPGNLFPLAAGKSTHELGIPVELPAGVRNVRVMLYGTLPESGVHGLLLTDVRPVAVRAGP
jgi:hypothetical protein